MLPSNNCYELTQQSEGLRLRSYRDTGGVWTIGYGHTKNVGPGQIITQDQATTLLHADMQAACVVVNNHCLPATQGQFDALVDFVFNVGPVQFLSSHLFTYHKTKQYDKAAAEFPKWKYDNGKVEPGLITRRAKEQALYTSQEPQADHPHTDAPEYSASSVPDPAPAVSPVVSSPPSVAPPVLDVDTVQGSSSGLSGLAAALRAALRSLLARGKG